MKTIDRIKNEIKQLSDRERAKLVRWMIDRDNEKWDEQMSEDAAAGRLQFLVDEAAMERKTRKLRKFP